MSDTPSSVAALGRALVKAIEYVNINYEQTSRLAKRVQACMPAIEKLPADTSAKLLGALARTFVDAKELVEVYSAEEWAHTVVQKGTDKAAFTDINDRFLAAVQGLKLNIKVKSVFDRSQDTDDQNKDAKFITKNKQQIEAAIARLASLSLQGNQSSGASGSSSSSSAPRPASVIPPPTGGPPAFSLYGSTTAAARPGNNPPGPPPSNPIYQAVDNVTVVSTSTYGYGQAASNNVTVSTNTYGSTSSYAAVGNGAGGAAPIYESTYQAPGATPKSIYGGAVTYQTGAHQQQTNYQNPNDPGYDSAIYGSSDTYQAPGPHYQATDIYQATDAGYQATGIYQATDSTYQAPGVAPPGGSIYQNSGAGAPPVYQNSGVSGSGPVYQNSGAGAPVYQNSGVSAGGPVYQNSGAGAATPAAAAGGAIYQNSGAAAAAGGAIYQNSGVSGAIYQNASVAGKPAPTASNIYQNSGSLSDGVDSANASSLSIPHATLKFEKALGSGTFGKVSLGKWNQETVAIKQLILTQLDARLLDEFRREVLAHGRIQHQNIAMLLGACFDANNYALVLEYFPSGSLRQLLADTATHPTLTLAVRGRILQDTARGMTCLARAGIVHRNLKSSNVLITSEMRAKVSDFGYARIRQETAAAHPPTEATLHYTAPELLTSENVPADEKSDVFAFGIVAWETAARQLPYKGMNDKAIRSAVNEGDRPDIPDDATPTLRALISRSWDQSPESRPTFSQLGDLVQQIADVSASPASSFYGTASNFYGTAAAPNAGPLYQSMDGAPLPPASSVQGGAAPPPLPPKRTSVAVTPAPAAPAVPVKTVSNALPLPPRAPRGAAADSGPQPLPQRPVSQYAVGSVAEATEQLQYGKDLMRRGATKQAKPCIEYAMDVYTKHYGPSHVHVAGIVLELGKACLVSGEHARARTLIQQALTTQEKIFGPNHVVTLATRFEFAKSCLATGSPKEAMEIFQQLLAVQETTFGPKHERVANTLMEIARCENALGNHAAAHALLNRAQHIKAQRHQADHIEFVLLTFEIGRTNNLVGDYAVALGQFDHALAVLRQHLGDGHITQAVVYVEKARAHAGLNEWIQTRNELERALGIQSRVYGTEHPELAVTLREIGQAYNKLGNREAAISYFQRAKVIEEPTYAVGGHVPTQPSNPPNEYSILTKPTVEEEADLYASTPATMYLSTASYAFGGMLADVESEA
ncbi:TKL protein kinase [Capsaspora owczarzaki ATCC 30864]|uniref:TKL protein kinase n=1 Tax=Capsaspora owczarzaki (strain ATCC 30864) TaxID=595528 RepID=A0A0D2X346_CAPO3|nr:TKL protein kinase [Capsaspora owczarzaki ATCC 30864]